MAKTPTQVGATAEKTATRDSIISEQVGKLDAAVEALGDDEEGDVVLDEAAETTDGDEDTAEQVSDDTLEKPDEETPKGGIAAALEHLDDFDPNLAKAVRELQKGYTQRSQEASQFAKDRAELADILREVKELRDAEPDEETPSAPDPSIEEAFKDLTPEQRTIWEKMFDAEAKRRGIVTDQALSSRDALKAQNAYVLERHREAAKVFGDDFGALADDGTLKLSDATRAALVETRDRLQATDKGVTWDDIYRITRFDAAVKAAEERGKQAVLTQLKKQGRDLKILKGGTVDSSTSPTDGKPQIYDRKRDKGKSDDVYGRAFEYAYRKLGMTS